MAVAEAEEFAELTALAEAQRDAWFAKLKQPSTSKHWSELDQPGG